MLYQNDSCLFLKQYAILESSFINSRKIRMKVTKNEQIEGRMKECGKMMRKWKKNRKEGRKEENKKERK